MYAYVLFAFICEVATIQSVDFNVGTVLFSNSDIKEKLWTRTEIGLLRARRHFQEVIPPPNMVTINEDYIYSMLDFLKDTYTTVKSEAKDAKGDSILNAALSDAIGGYLKSWVLPITKFAYYGGTVSQEDASKLFKLYDEIKSSLNTNGGSWRSPNTYLLNFVAINVIPLVMTKTRGANNACDTLAYFEKTDIGLSVPVPTVNWNGNSASMFVPLKNQSLIPLNSRNKEHLINYYNAATNCIGDNKPEDQAQFEARFQNWLTSDVIPHLNDEQFYPALGSVLSLVNKTRNLVDTVIELYGDSTTPIIKKSTIAGIPIHLSSKKMMVITIIIVIEVAWCVPTLCYMLYRRIKRNKTGNLYLYVEKSKGNKNRNRKCPCFTASTQYAKQISEKSVMCVNQLETKYVQTTESRLRTEGLNLVQQPRPKSDNLETQQTKSFSNICIPKNIQSCPNPQMSIQKLSPKICPDAPVCLKSSLIKPIICEIDKEKSTTSREIYSCLPAKSSLSSVSITKIQELELTKTVTILNDCFNSRTVPQIAYIDIGEAPKSSSSTELTDSTKETCVEREISKVCSDKELVVLKPRVVESTSKPAASYTKTDSKTVRSKNQRHIKDSNRKGIKLSSGQPYLEITIDRPQKHISVDFSEVREKAKSKIPKPASNNEPHAHVSTKPTHIPSAKRKSYIPQRKRESTTDDIVVKTGASASKANSSLNLTL